MDNQTFSALPGDAASGTSDISKHIIIIFTWVVVTGLCQLIDAFGIVTNVINIACFAKQGFKEAVNISLFGKRLSSSFIKTIMLNLFERGLAISDLGCLVTQVFISILYTLDASTLDLTFEALDVAYLTAGTPHLAFNRINIWITVIITLERCLCITIPLKMRSIVTTRRVWFLICFGYVIFLLSTAPIFAVNKLDIKFSPVKNRSVLGVVSSPFKDQVEGITFTIAGFIFPFIAFITIIICTVILVTNLRVRDKWLKKSTTISQADISSRDQKVAKMVVMVSGLFIVCFVPLAGAMLAITFEPNLKVGGNKFNIGKILINIVLLMESINSSANIFIYHRMSKKYRDTFELMFCRNNNKL